MDYHAKYLKYKRKYESLKPHTGGFTAGEHGKPHIYVEDDLTIFGDIKRNLDDEIFSTIHNSLDSVSFNETEDLRNGKFPYGDFRNYPVVNLNPWGPSQGETVTNEAMSVVTRVVREDLKIQPRLKTQQEKNKNPGKETQLRKHPKWVSLFLGYKYSDRFYTDVNYSDHKMRDVQLLGGTYVTWNTLQQEAVNTELALVDKNLEGKINYEYDGTNNLYKIINFAEERMYNLFYSIIDKFSHDSSIKCVALQECEVWLVKLLYQRIKDHNLPYLLNYCPSQAYEYKKSGKQTNFVSSYGTCLIVKENDSPLPVDRDYLSYSQDNLYKLTQMTDITDTSDITDFNLYSSKFCTMFYDNTLYISIHVQPKNIQYIKDDICQFIREKRLQPGSNYDHCNKIVIMGDFNASPTDTVQNMGMNFSHYMDTQMLSPYFGNKLNFTLSSQSLICAEGVDHIFIYNKNPEGGVFINAPIPTGPKSSGSSASLSHGYKVSDSHTSGLKSSSSSSGYKVSDPHASSSKSSDRVQRTFLKPETENHVKNFKLLPYLGVDSKLLKGKITSRNSNGKFCSAELLDTAFSNKYVNIYCADAAGVQLNVGTLINIKFKKAASGKYLFEIAK